MTTPPNPSLDRILSQVRPSQRVDNTTIVETGNRKRTTIVRFVDDESVVVQQSDDPAVARIEAALVAAIAERTSVPVAPLLASGTDSGEGWLVTSLVEGEDLHERFVDLGSEIQRQLAAAFGRYLAELHEAFRFDSYGPIGLENGRLDTGRQQSSGDDWQDWFGGFADTSIERLPAAFDSVRPRLQAVVQDEAGDAPPPRLFPWDLRPGNALVDDGQLAAHVDWEGPLAADPALSVAKTEYLVADWYVSPEQADMLRAAFRASYRSVRSLPVVRPAHRVAAIADTAVDSRGSVTKPRYPPVDREAAVAFHRRALEQTLR